MPIATDHQAEDSVGVYRDGVRIWPKLDVLGHAYEKTPNTVTQDIGKSQFVVLPAGHSGISPEDYQAFIQPEPKKVKKAVKTVKRVESDDGDTDGR